VYNERNSKSSITNTHTNEDETVISISKNRQPNYIRQRSASGHTKGSITKGSITKGSITKGRITKGSITQRRNKNKSHK
jgi:hypothetical protein